MGSVLEARATQAELANEGKRQTGPVAGWVLLADVAADLRISRSHLRTAVEDGELVGGRYRQRVTIQACQLGEWVESRRLQTRRREPERRSD